MASNDQIIFDQALEQQRQQRAPSSSKSEFFEMYVAEQVLKDFDLSDEELEAGVVGGGGDGGIDGIYVFANGELIREDFDVSALKKNIIIEVVIVQSKLAGGFDEATMNRFNSTTSDLFDLSKPVNEFAKVYNEDLRSAVQTFRQVYEALAARFPKLRFRYVYATRGDSKQVHPNIRKKLDDLARSIQRLFSSANFDFEFLGASDLLALARRQPVTSFELVVAESISAQGGYIALVKLREFDKFLRDDKGQLRKHLFEANVRDYQGATQVNEEIQKSLSSGTGEDFWWLNNGVTIIASKAIQSAKSLTIEDPQVVNGLQTSTEIFKFFSNINPGTDDRHVMVRVVVPGKAESSDRIIKATNSQTSIPPASLRATDKIHRDIEEFLRPFGLFYDRRKNMHKNEGRAIESIISIPLMAQSVMAILLHRPNDARARPSSLLKKDEDYTKIFDVRYPIELYLTAAKLIKLVEANLRAREELQPKDRNNLLFYVAMHAASALTGKRDPNASNLAAVKSDQITDKLIDESVRTVSAAYQKLGASDQTAKGTKLLETLLTDLS